MVTQTQPRTHARNVFFFLSKGRASFSVLKTRSRWPAGGTPNSTCLSGGQGSDSGQEVISSHLRQVPPARTSQRLWGQSPDCEMVFLAVRRIYWLFLTSALWQVWLEETKKKDRGGAAAASGAQSSNQKQPLGESLKATKKNKFTSQVFADDHEVMSSVCCSHEARRPLSIVLMLQNILAARQPEGLQPPTDQPSQRSSGHVPALADWLRLFHLSRQQQWRWSLRAPIALTRKIRTSWFPQSHHKRRKTREKAPRYRNIVLTALRTSMAEDICAGKSEKCWAFTERDTEKWEKSDEWRLNSLTGGQRTTWCLQCVKRKWEEVPAAWRPGGTRNQVKH